MDILILFVFGLFWTVQGLTGRCYDICIDDLGLTCESSHCSSQNSGFNPDEVNDHVLVPGGLTTRSRPRPLVKPCANGQDFYVEEGSTVRLGQPDVCSLFRESSLNPLVGKSMQPKNDDDDASGFSLTVVVLSLVGGLVFGVIVMVLILKFGQKYLNSRTNYELSKVTVKADPPANSYTAAASPDPSPRSDDTNVNQISGQTIPSENGHTDRDHVPRPDSSWSHQYESVYEQDDDQSYDYPEIRGIRNQINVVAMETGETTDLHSYAILKPGSQNVALEPASGTSSNTNTSTREPDHSYFVLKPESAHKLPLHPPKRNK